jgi:hypothetical protein
VGPGRLPGDHSLLHLNGTITSAVEGCYMKPLRHFVLLGAQEAWQGVLLYTEGLLQVTYGFIFEVDEGRGDNV